MVMSLEVFEIFLDSEASAYQSGETISGRVYIRTKSSIKANDLTITFSGKAIVAWTSINQHNQMQEGHSKSETFFSFKKNLIENKSKEFIISIGEYFFPFSFQIPSGQLSTSFYGRHGGIGYKLSAVIDRAPFKVDLIAKKQIIIFGSLDLNNYQGVGNPQVWSEEKTFGCFCCTNGMLQIKVGMERTGYIPGESILIHVDINNLSGKNVNDLSVKLIQSVYYTNENVSTQTTTVLNGARRDKYVYPGEIEEWVVGMKIPENIPPSRLGGDCNIIILGYSIQVEAKVSGVDDVKLNCPIVVGTIALNPL